MTPNEETIFDYKSLCWFWLFFSHADSERKRRLAEIEVTLPHNFKIPGPIVFTQRGDVEVALVPQIVAYVPGASDPWCSMVREIERQWAVHLRLQAPTKVVVDLAQIHVRDLEYYLYLLLKIARAIRVRGGDMKVCNVPPALKALAPIVVLKPQDSLEAAVDSFAGPSKSPQHRPDTGPAES